MYVIRGGVLGYIGNLDVIVVRSSESGGRAYSGRKFPLAIIMWLPKTFWVTTKFRKFRSICVISSSAYIASSVSSYLAVSML